MCRSNGPNRSFAQASAGGRGLRSDRTIPVMATRGPRSISLDAGGDEPVVITPRAGSRVAECRGPEGVAGEAAADAVARAVSDETHGPPLPSHVVPGDRVAIALAGVIPQREAVMGAVRHCLEAAGVADGDITIVEAAPDGDLDTSYLAADEAGEPFYLARQLVDADVVVAIGAWCWDAAFGGRSIAGELWPTFGRPEVRRDLVRQLARRGRGALAGWRAAMQLVDWNLGVMANLKLVAGRDGTLAAAVFGLPNQARRAIRRQAAGWRPVVTRRAALTVASISRPPGAAAADGMQAAIRAVAAAARVTTDEGTICLAGRIGAEPGVILSRWRQGASLRGLVHEALRTDNEDLIADALRARLFARALGDRRLVLLTDLDQTVVEELDFGHAETPAAIARLAAKSSSLVVLHEADRMLPR